MEILFAESAPGWWNDPADATNCDFAGVINTLEIICGYIGHYDPAGRYAITCPLTDHPDQEAIVIRFQANCQVIAECTGGCPDAQQFVWAAQTAEYDDRPFHWPGVVNKPRKITTPEGPGMIFPGDPPADLLYTLSGGKPWWETGG